MGTTCAKQAPDGANEMGFGTPIFCYPCRGLENIRAVRPIAGAMGYYRALLRSYFADDEHERFRFHGFILPQRRRGAEKNLADDRGATPAFLEQANLRKMREDRKWDVRPQQV